MCISLDLSEKHFEVGPPIGNFLPFFQFPIPNISAKSTFFRSNETGKPKCLLISSVRFWKKTKCGQNCAKWVPYCAKIKTLIASFIAQRVRPHCLSFLNRKPGRLIRFYTKIFGAPRKNNTVVFVADLKKSATQKTRFFPLDRNFGFRLFK